MKAAPGTSPETAIAEVDVNSGVRQTWVEICDRHGEPEPCRSCPTRRVSDIQPEQVRWLTNDQIIPRGMVTVFGGLPGIGKSTINYDLGARVSRNGEHVLILTAEDHMAAVIRPRVEAAGANLDLVHVLVIDLTLPEHTPDLKSIVRDIGATLVVIDPLVAFIGDGVNTHRDHHVRRVLAPLGDLAEDTGASVITVIHVNKGQSSEALLRISGSIGFTGAARTVIMAAEDPKDDTRSIFWVAKSNVAKKPAPRAFRLVPVDLGDGITTSKVEWLGDAPDVDVRELLSSDRSERQGDRARAFLRESGVNERARPAAELEAEAEGQGINYRTLRRAADDLSIPKWKDGFQGAWWWGPRGQDEEDKQRGHATVIPLSPSTRPAETVTNGTEGDSELEAGKGPCPDCGAVSAEPGYPGHGMHCQRFR